MWMDKGQSLTTQISLVVELSCKWWVSWEKEIMKTMDKWRNQWRVLESQEKDHNSSYIAKQESQSISSRIKKISFQTPLGALLGFESQTYYKAGTDFRVEQVSKAVVNVGLVWLLPAPYPVDSGPKLAMGHRSSR